jgi:tetratricopeptide (TPR) repeat protein
MSNDTTGPGNGSPRDQEPVDDYGELSLEYEYHNLANDYYKIGEFDKAIEHYNKALELRPDLLETYFNRGLAYTRKGLYDHAQEDLNKVIELNPNLAEAYYTRGLIHEYKLEYPLAINDYNKALEVDPKYNKAETQKLVARNKMAGLQGAAYHPDRLPMILRRIDK